MDITPDKQNIDTLFSNTTYYIDFYQRQYKWNEGPVRRLLDDIFYKFNEEHRLYATSDIDDEKIISKYAWYYLNTYVTNQDADGRLYVVDGQQRLTTLTLILIKLYRMSAYFGSELTAWLSTKIVGVSGKKKTFWMNHELHEPTLRALFDGKDEIPTESGISAKNMERNYREISKRLDSELTDIKIFERFSYYFLRRLVIINLEVKQTDVPMVFEVINDRGVKLKPHEILKGKLLGQIDKEELKELNFNDLWDNRAKEINKDNVEEFDNFFVYYLKSKYTKNVTDSKKFDKDYHRSIFTDTTLELDHNEVKVKKFLQSDFIYYTGLYTKLLNYKTNYNTDFRHVYYNYLTDRGQQFMLIMSACRINDPQEDQKIRIVSSSIDRLFCLLQLQKSYDSNHFNKAMYEISEKIREKSPEEIKNIFDEYLLAMLSQELNNDIKEPFTYGYFKDTGIELDKRFKRYLFARIEEFIAENTNMNMKHSLYNLVVNYGSVNGFHIEHILAENEDNYTLFDNDEELFRSQRNRLGGLLLLKGGDNISSSNEPYTDKLRTYANTLYWNETLREDTYKSKLDFKNMAQRYNLNFRPMHKFGKEELEERHRLLFDIISIIWK